MYNCLLNNSPNHLHIRFRPVRESTMLNKMMVKIFNFIRALKNHTGTTK